MNLDAIVTKKGLTKNKVTASGHVIFESEK
jgi:hypothetical protein